MKAVPASGRIDRVRLLVAVCLLSTGIAEGAQGDLPAAAGAATSASGRFTFAVVGTATDRDDRSTVPLLRAIDGSGSSFVVHFELSAPSPTSCGDAALERRRAVLDASPRPVVPVTGASQWAACGRETTDALDRLDRVGDLLFGADQSLGQERLPWSRQSGIARFHRYRENVRWQVGGILFATLNLPDNNNNFRIGAGRNGEFEERVVANRAWLDRTFRLATERRAVGVVLFIDASSRFSAPMRAPDSRARERDGFYEWKVALRERVPAYKGQVLLVQSRLPADVTAPQVFDQPLRGAAGHPIGNLTRVAIADAAGDQRWLRIDVDPADPRVFRPTVERSFDDPSGELYGTSSKTR